MLEKGHGDRVYSEEEVNGVSATTTREETPESPESIGPERALRTPGGAHSLKCIRV